MNFEFLVLQNIQIKLAVDIADVRASKALKQVTDADSFYN